ncbi:MAG TPA: MFS transporter, partial [Leptospiraceae bacterium]|nr:MFS transporter [Leptospiraceae bacterium]
GQWTSILLLGCAYFFIKFIRYTLWSWAPYVLRKNYDQAGDMAGYVSTLFDLFGIVGVLTAGYLSDKFFNGRRALVSLIFLSGMTLATLWLRIAGDHNLIVFAISMALIGFMLYGPDALLTGAGAIDLGSIRHATLAAGIINGMGAVGPVVQDILIGDLYERFGGSLTPIFALLFGSALCSTLVLAYVVIRNRSHISDV